MTHTVRYWHLTPPQAAQDLHSALQETAGLPRVLAHTRQCCPEFPATLLCLMWEQTPAPVTDVNPARASFALTHTGNPWQAQELDPTYSSFSPELCDLWYCCNETCLTNFVMNAMKLCFTHALTPKITHSIFQWLQHHFSTIFVPNSWSISFLCIMFCSLSCPVLTVVSVKNALCDQHTD